MTSPLASHTNDTGGSLRFIRVSGYAELFPRLVLNTSNPIYCGRDERSDPSAGSYTLTIRNGSTRLTTLALIVASVVDASIVWVLFVGVARMGVVVVQGLP